MNTRTSLLALAALAAFARPARAQETPPAVEPVLAGNPVPAAIFAFSERGAEVKGLGDKISDLLFAGLATVDSLWLVDREELDKVVAEHELNLSGMVNPAQAVQIGSLTGAKVLITGSVFQVDKDIHIVAKVIGTETTRVLGASVKGPAKDDLGPLVAQLSLRVAETVAQKANLLVAPVVKIEDRIAALSKALGDKKRPSVAIKVVERHVGQATIDPAAETELSLFCKETGFTVFDAADAGKADIRIEGEGFSEFGLRRGSLISVKARLEVKAVDPATNEVLTVDRETTVEVDVVEQMAGKKALQSAAARIAERMLPKLVK